MKNNRKCILCGKEYSYCGSGCRGDAGKPTWMKLYCSENCKNIFSALNDYNFKLIDKTQAQERLSACDLSIKLNDHYRSEIEDITAKPKHGLRLKAGVIDEAMPEDIKEEAQEELDGVVTIE